jgi:hypothetical protein
MWEWPYAQGVSQKRKTEGRPKTIYAQATRDGIEMPTVTANNTQEHTLISIMQESFTGFETFAIWSSKSKDVNTEAGEL